MGKEKVVMNLVQKSSVSAAVVYKTFKKKKKEELKHQEKDETKFIRTGEKVKELLRKSN